MDSSQNDAIVEKNIAKTMYDLFFNNWKLIALIFTFTIAGFLFGGNITAGDRDLQTLNEQLNFSNSVEHVGDKFYCKGKEKLTWVPTGIAGFIQCAEDCKGKSIFFAVGTNRFGKPRCTGISLSGIRCKCYCQYGPNDDGKCERITHKGYIVLKYKAPYIMIVEKRRCPSWKTFTVAIGVAGTDECARICRKKQYFKFFSIERTSSRRRQCDCVNHDFCTTSDQTSDTRYNTYRIMRF